MEGGGSHERSSNSKQSDWTIGDVMMSDSAGLLDLGNDVDVDSFMNPLSDHGESLLSEETVNKITEILTPEQRMLLEEEVVGSLMKNVSDTPGLANQGTVRPCFQTNEHAQTCTTTELRPSHGGQDNRDSAQFLAHKSVGNKQRMQHENKQIKTEALGKSSAIQEGLQKLKQQLGKGGKLVSGEADPGPAVVTEFIGDHGNIGFAGDLDDISKCSMDSQDDITEKPKEADPPVRRSGRKIIRLFEIVPPKKGRKKDAESDDSSGAARSSEKQSSTNAKDSASKVVNQKRGGSNDEKDTSPPRKSLRRQKADSSDEKTDDGKDKKAGRRSKQPSDNEETKKRGPGRPAKVKSEDEKKSIGRKSIEKAKTGRKSDDEQGRKRLKIRKHQPGKSRGRPPKSKEGTDAKVGKKKPEKRKPRRKTKGDEDEDVDGDRSEEEGSKSSDSEPDDGELSDAGSEFDPDDDPDRPWCICRKPHGNRFMICCDTCEDWYHGDCVGVTQADGKELEKRGEEWMCPKCKRKLNALAKELKEKERKERIKMRQKTEGSSDESSAVEMRKKLLKALEKELDADKVKKNFEKDDLSDSEEDDAEEEEEVETKVENEEPVVEDIKEKMKKRTKKKMSKEEREAKEAKQREKELEWQKQLKEMKARAQKAEQIARRKDSIENQITFEKIGSQKIVKPKEEQATVKQESSEKKPDIVKKEVKVRFLDTVTERRKSDSSLKDSERKRTINSGRRASNDDPKEKIAKTEDLQKKQVRITPTPKTVKPVAPLKYCIVCSKLAMKNAVYCSKECITSYTKESLRLIAEDKQKRLGPKSPEVKSPVSKDAPKGPTSIPAVSTNEDDKNERVAVVERSTKKVIAGLMAPTRANIYKWVEEHPTFEVFRPASAVHEGYKTSSFYGGRKMEKVRLSAATTASTSLKDKKDLTEVVRNNVKKSLKETILTRCRDVEMEVDADEVSKICIAIEEEIVKMYGDTGQKYKTKYRSLIFNLKDPKNRSLYKQVVLGELTPSKLVHMSPEQLASAELAKWREREAKHNLELIKKREEEDAYALKHALKKTHKGEVELEQDGEEDMKNLQTHLENPEEHKEHQPEEGASAVPFEDTTEQHNSHLFDLNCKICTGKQQPVGEKQPILPHVSTSIIHTIPESSTLSPTGSPEEMDLKQSSPDLIESMDRSPIHIPLPSKERDDPVWKGHVVMPSVAKFSANAYRISGPCEHLSKIVPDTVNICGRISHEQVWDYLYQLKSTTHKTIEILRFEMASEDEKKNYVALYSYFYTRKRIGVIGNCYSGVKDMYIVPIASHDPIPPELKPFDGPGMPESRPHMLIGIIVRTKPILPSKRPKSDHHESAEHSHKSKKKHKHKKEEKKKYEDIVFGKQKAAFNLEETPSETESSYTPSYTPSYTTDVMSPPSQMPASAASTAKNEENKLLEEKLAKQKEELLKLQAEIRAQINVNKALGIQPKTLMETSSVGAPSSTSQESQESSTSFSGSSVSASSVPLSSSTSSAPTTDFSATTSSSASQNSVGVASTYHGQPGQVKAMLAPSQGTPNAITTVGDSAHTSVQQYNVASGGHVATAGHVAPASHVAPVASSVYQPSSTSSVASVPGSLPSTVNATEVQNVAAKDTINAGDEDEPYDPEDELDTALELDSKDQTAKDGTKKDAGEKDGGDKGKAGVASGDEPYDPEDDFVLDLIEDISLPTSLKKIDKPNLPFPLEMPKKPENKMPELPPIKLPEKITDRRAIGMVSANTPVDPRSNASPMGHAFLSHTPTGTPNTQSPSSKSLTSPSSSSSQMTSPNSQRSLDPRQAPQPGPEKSDSTHLQGGSKSESAAQDRTQPGADYWQSNRGQEQSYSAYNQYQTSGGQQQSHGNYHDSYGDSSYNQQWQAGQRGSDSTWQGYDYNNTRQGDGRTWEGGDQSYRASSWRGDYYGNQAYDNSSYQRTQDNSNYDNHRRDDRGRAWDEYGERGYYRNAPRDRGRSNKWR